MKRKERKEKRVHIIRIKRSQIQSENYITNLKKGKRNRALHQRHVLKYGARGVPDFRNLESRRPSEDWPETRRDLSEDGIRFKKDLETSDSGKYANE